MSATPDWGFDLAVASTWHGLRPGMPRAEVLRALESNGAEISEDETDPEWLLAMWEGGSFELLFGEASDRPLRQISVDTELCRWAGKPIVNRPLHEALTAMGDGGRDASWRPEDPVLGRLDDLKALGTEHFADETLLSEGTVWLPQRALGLVMCEGIVNEIVWRRSEDLPRQFAGPVTDSQKRITALPDFQSYLRKHYAGPLKTTPSPSATPSTPSQKALTALFLCGLAWLSWQALRETQRWQKADILPGKLVALEKVDGKPYARVYRVAFDDPEHRPQFANLERADFYVAPNEIGEEVQVAYVPGNPPQVKGLPRARDAAFLRYVPWYVALVAVYGTLRIVLGFIARREPSQADVVSRPVLPTNSGNG